MAWPLRRHRPSVQLPRQANREIADIDHLLDLAEGLGADLPDLDRHEICEVLLVILEESAEALDQRTSLGRRHCSPFDERLMRASDHVIDVTRACSGDAEQVHADDGGSCGNPLTFENMCTAGEERTSGDGVEVSR